MRILLVIVAVQSLNLVVFLWFKLIWNERHLRCLLTEFSLWYNHGRVHQGLNGIPDPDPALAEPKPVGGRLVAIPVLNGSHHDYRLAA